MNETVIELEAEFNSLRSKSKLKGVERDILSCLDQTKKLDSEVDSIRENMVKLLLFIIHIIRKSKTLFF